METNYIAPNPNPNPKPVLEPYSTDGDAGGDTVVIDIGEAVADPQQTGAFNPHYGDGAGAGADTEVAAASSAPQNYAAQPQARQMVQQNVVQQQQLYQQQQQQQPQHQQQLQYHQQMQVQGQAPVIQSNIGYGQQYQQQQRQPQQQMVMMQPVMQMQPQQVIPVMTKDQALRHALRNDRCCCCESRVGLIIAFVLVIISNGVNLALFQVWVNWVVCGCAVVWAAIGLYGVTSYKRRYLRVCLVVGVVYLLIYIIFLIVLCVRLDDILYNAGYSVYVARERYLSQIIVSGIIHCLMVAWVLRNVQTALRAVRSVKDVLK